MQVEIGDVSERASRTINRLTQKERRAALIQAATAKLEADGRTPYEIDAERKSRKMAGIIKERFNIACESVRLGRSKPVERDEITGRSIIIDGQRFILLGEVHRYRNTLVAKSESGEYRFIDRRETVK